MDGLITLLISVVDFTYCLGLSNAMLLPRVTAFSIPATPQRYADCARNGNSNR